MQRKKIIATTALIVMAGAVDTTLADFSGFTKSLTRFYEADGSTLTDSGSAAYAVMDLYANFSAMNTHGYDNADTRMLSIYNVNVELFDSSTGFFYHDDLVGRGDAGEGSWKPSFSFDVPGTANSTIDSFVTIGGGVGNSAASNVTTPDPNLGEAESHDIFNEDVGWFLNPPTSPQADVDGNLQVWIGRFVATGDSARNGAYFDLSGTASYNYGSGTGLFSGDDSGSFMWVPAPGALAMFGIGGVVLRRRRR